MQIDRLILGDFQTNCYVVRQEKAGDRRPETGGACSLQPAASSLDCIVIDPGFDPDDLFEFLAQHQLNPVAVILTHGHVDHIAGVAALRQQYPKIKVHIHKVEAGLLTDPEANLSALVGFAVATEPAEVLLQDGDTIDEAGLQLKVLHTPGHTLGGICLYAESEGVVFAGDTLFADSVGRTDFPGGDRDQLIESIRTKLFALPDKTTVYSGHGMRTTIGREKRTNPFVQGL